ncbi:MAG: Response regulator receiver protein [uncultured Sulfurovum sp.]|uniref:Response regulator receiver protein n=1 Tax=uncultured Sulfurovum sp. TaxID=269237 RepID=A0A6S6TCX7_9BACT|nr:MAG: Response regulator receiver protein [uncultured Sulfurovum sp.]
MKKVLIFENEIPMVENTFKSINLLDFEEKLEIQYMQTSQELKNINEIIDYDLVIIDIDLSNKSDKDGIGIIQDIKRENEKMLEKIFVLTGSTKVKNTLNNLGFTNIPILKKPANLDEISKEMTRILK